MKRNMCNSKLLFGSFNTMFFICGFLEVVCGFLLLCDSRRLLLSRLLASPDEDLSQPPFYYLALALLAAGLAVCATSALGCWATYMPGYVILSIYFLVVLSLLLAACASGVLAAVWPRCVGLHNVRGGAVGALQAYYGVPDYESFTAAMDLAHTELECCGMTDGHNFDMSVWQLRRLGPRGLSVPLSCCVQDSAEDYLNPTPLNQTVCQEVTPDPQYRYVEGCLEKLEDWYQQQYLVFLMGLLISSLFKVGILLSTIFSCVSIRKDKSDFHSYIMKTIDKNTNENIYGSRMGTLMNEEPITAKYVQPNNFYSPRVRNPRIFHNKPNEIV